MAERTFSFLARSASDAERAAIFTLHGRRLSIVPGGALAYVQRRLGDDQEEGRRRLPWLKPSPARAVELLQPIDVNDVKARASGERLMVRAWLRGAGLRLAPLTFRWHDVDNPEAAAGFVRELRRRQETQEKRRGLPGPLDYWGFWGLVGALSGLAVQFAVKKQEGES